MDSFPRIRTAIILMAISTSAAEIFAQDLKFSVSPTPVGSGARAAGMDNAFVAIADDATAASWNPAGLVQLELPEFSIVGTYNSVTDRFYGLSGGIGLLVKQRANIDLAYQFRYGPGVNKDYVQGIGGFADDLVQHRFLLSSVVYFKTGR